MAVNPHNLNGIRLTEEDVRAVLQRASQYDGSVSVAELSSVAAEAGISEQAVVKAVMEVLAERETPPSEAAEEMAHPGPWRSEPGGSWHSVLFGAAAGMVSGALTSGGQGVAIMSAAVLGAGLVFRAFDNRRHGSHRRFQLEAASCASGVAAGLFVTVGLPDDGAAVVGTAWMATSVLGGVIISSAPARTIGRFVRSRFGSSPKPGGTPYSQSFAQPRHAS